MEIYVKLSLISIFLFNVYIRLYFIAASNTANDDITNKAAHFKKLTTGNNAFVVSVVI